MPHVQGTDQGHIADHKHLFVIYAPNASTVPNITTLGQNI